MTITENVKIHWATSSNQMEGKTYILPFSFVQERSDFFVCSVVPRDLVLQW